jgi:hypothetical protein
MRCVNVLSATVLFATTLSVNLLSATILSVLTPFSELPNFSLSACENALRQGEQSAISR